MFALKHQAVLKIFFPEQSFVVYDCPDDTFAYIPIEITHQGFSLIHLQRNGFEYTIGPIFIAHMYTLKNNF